MKLNIADVEVIAPNFKRRLSGVTSTIVALVPLQAETLGIATLGPGLPNAFPKLGLLDLPKLWKRPARRPFRIFHARRNIEMLAGLVMRDLMRMPMRLVFTSAAQRRHTVWTKFLIGRMDAVIATSSRSAAYLDRPATIILHGIALNRFSPDGPRPEGPVAKRLSGMKIVGCSGRIRHQKGTDVFVDAMLDLLPWHPGWSAVVTGRTTVENAGFEAGLRARIAEAGLGDRILFTGEVDDIAPWFRRFDLYVAPPRNEGFGLTPLEAMAARTAVVASDAGAFRDLIIEGKTGRVVPAGDPAALAKAIEPFLSDEGLRTCTANAAFADVRRRFPLAREAAEIAAVYEQLWSGGKPVIVKEAEAPR